MGWRGCGGLTKKSPVSARAVATMLSSSNIQFHIAIFVLVKTLQASVSVQMGSRWRASRKCVSRFNCLLLQVNLTQNTKTTSHQKWRQPHHKMKTASPRKLRLSHPKKNTKYEDDLFWAYTKFAATLLKSHLFRFLWPLPGGQGHHNFNMSVCLFYHLFFPVTSPDIVQYS